MAGLIGRLVERMNGVLGITPRLDPLGTWRGRPTVAGVSIDEGSALGIPALWSAVNLYASTIAALDLEVAERNRRGGSSPAPDHPLYDVLASRPNAYQPAAVFRQAILGHALTFGNGYAEIEWSADGRYVDGLHLMDPRNVEPKWAEGRRLVYRLKREGDELDAADVVHIRGLSFDGLRGYSPITIAREALGTAKAQEVYDAALFGNGAKPSGHLEFPGTLNAKQQADVRSSWNGEHGGPANAGKLGILYGGAKWVQTSFTPADAQMILARGFSVLEVARLYRVPPHMLGDLQGATVGNAEQQALQFVKFSLLPWLKLIEGEYDLKLFGPVERRRYFARHDVTALERGDMAARTQHNQGMFNSGVISINEWRLREGMDTLSDPNADQHWIPTNNLTAIETLPTGKPTTPATANPAEAEDDEDGD